MIAVPRKLRERHGQALVGMAVGMVAFTALAVAGVDLARLGFTANEVQTLADVSATAGLRALLNGQSAVTAAQQTAAVNTVDGHAGAINPPGTVIVGTYNPATGAFTPGGASPNAVQANAERTVNNFMAGAIGFSQTKVTKTAIAAYQTTGSGNPTIPLALDDCSFPAGCHSQSCLPNLITVPSTSDNSGWTALTNGTASTSTIMTFFPAACGGSGATANVGIGTNISLSNGNITQLFNAVQCMLCNQSVQPKQFLVPVVHNCTSNFNQSKPVVGFATVEIDHFITSNNTSKTCGNGGGAIKQIVLKSIFKADEPGGPPGTGSCTGCGTGYVTMVN